MIRVGAWFAICCELDLYQIATEEQCDEARELWNDGLALGCWESKGAALADIYDDPTTEVERPHKPRGRVDGVTAAEVIERLMTGGGPYDHKVTPERFRVALVNAAHEAALLEDRRRMRPISHEPGKD